MKHVSPSDFITDKPKPIVCALQKVRRLLERGWCQGTMRKGDSFCVLGAIGHLGVGYDGKIIEVITCAIPHHDRVIQHHNDAPDMTKEKVLAWMDDAILLALAEA